MYFRDTNQSSIINCHLSTNNWFWLSFLAKSTKNWPGG